LGPSLSPRSGPLMLFAGSRAGACRASASRRHPAGLRPVSRFLFPCPVSRRPVGNLGFVPHVDILRGHAAGDLERGERIEAAVRTAPLGAWRWTGPIAVAGAAIAFAMASASGASTLVSMASIGLGAAAGGFLALAIVGRRSASSAPFGSVNLTIAATDRRLLFYGRSPVLGVLRGPLLGEVRYPDLIAIQAGVPRPMLPTPLLVAFTGGPRLELEAPRAEDVAGFVRLVERLTGRG